MRLKFVTIFYFIFFTISCSAIADELKFKGTIDYLQSSFKQNKDLKNIPDSWYELKFSPIIEYSPNDLLKINLEPDIRKNFNLEERNNYNFRELWVEILEEKWSIKIGKQIIEWGRTDTIKPANVFNVKDLTDLINNIDTGIHAVEFSHYIGMHELELVWIPVFTPHRLPYNENNRWFIFPRTKILNSGPVNLKYYIDENNLPEKNINSSEYGIRFNYLGTGFDWAITGAKSFDRIPTYFQQEQGSYDFQKNEALIHVLPNYKSIYLVGVDGAAAISQYGLRTDLAYVFTEDMKSAKDEIDDPYLQMVFGMDRNFSRIFRDWDLFILLQYALDKELPVQGKENQDEPYSKLKHFYRQAGLFNSELKFSEFKKLVFKGFSNLEKEDYLFQMEYVYKPWDVVETMIGGDIPGGKKDGFFGYFDKSDRMRIGVKYYF